MPTKEDDKTLDLKPYWRTWLILLALTLAMVVIDQLALPRGALMAVLVAAMLTKATIIAVNFMHLKDERLSLGISVSASLLFFGGVLFLFMVPDGLRLFDMVYRW